MGGRTKSGGRRKPFDILVFCDRAIGKSPTFAGELAKELSEKDIDFREQHQAVLETTEGGYLYRITVRGLYALQIVKLTEEEIHESDIIFHPWIGGPRVDDRFRILSNRPDISRALLKAQREGRVREIDRSRELNPELKKELLTLIRRHAKANTV